MSFFKRIFSSKKQEEDLEKGIEKTKSSFLSKITHAVAGKSKVDDEVLDELEGALIASDVGLDTTIEIIRRLEERVARDKYLGTDELHRILKEEIISLLSDEGQEGQKTGFDIPAAPSPYVIMVVGVNGVGKTTTIGKLALRLKQQGKKVVLGAADTFRAAAVDQLKIWAERVDVDIYSKGMHTDPAAVAFEAVKHGVDTGADVVIVDTAGRLHTKINLMKELSKIKRSMDKVLPGAPHEVLLVLDATTGQNAIEQCKQFTEATEVSALALTKLDGTAKGGVAIGISHEFKIPIKYIGVGEGMDHLQPFDAETFIAKLFDRT